MKAAVLPARVFRVGRLPRPFAWPDWAYAERDGTFGNRFDDPSGIYRVLYAATEPEGAFVETLARFRPDPSVFAELDRITDDSEPALARGVVPAAWLTRRAMAVGAIAGAFVDLGAVATLGELRVRLSSRLRHYGLDDLDAATIRLSTPRRLTQEVSRLVYETTAVAGDRTWEGIAYRSRLGDDLHNWAIFEPNEPAVLGVEPLRRDDPALRAALDLLGLELGD